MIEVKAFKCDYCNMVSIYKGHVRRHELRHCRKNSDRRCCKLCVYLIDDEDGVYCEELQQDLDWNTLNANNECECFISKIVNRNKT